MYNRSVADLQVGSVVAGCRIDSVAGRGGMGVVYRATQLGLERQVALKVIAPEFATDAIFAARFKAESRLAAAIEHPNVVPIYEGGEGDGVLYLLMRFVDGTDLRHLLDSEGAVDSERAAKLLAQIASALGAAHRRGLVHRDVKPANVLITTDEGDDHAYLTDFGVAKALESTGGVTRTGAIVGTPDYMAPERLEDGVGDGRSDIYALGCVLYQSLTGRLPFPRDNAMAKVFAHLNAPVPAASEINPFVPEALDQVVARAMAKRPDERYQSAGAMRSALLAAVGDLEGARRDPTVPRDTITVAAAGDPVDEVPEAPAPVAREPTVPDTTPPAATTALPKQSATRRRSRIAAGLLAIGVIALIVVLVLALMGRLGGAPEKPDEPAPKANIGKGEPIPVGNSPAGVIAAGGIWVANSGDDTVTRISPETREVEQSAIQVGSEPVSITMGENAAWVANRSSNDVTQIDRGLFSATGTVKVGDSPAGITAGNGGIWVANSGDGSITWIDENDPDNTDTFDVGGEPIGIAYGDGGLWVADAGEGTLTLFDPDSHEPKVGPIGVGQGPRAVARGFGSIWVANAGDGHVLRIDPQSGEVLWNQVVAPALVGIGAGPTGMWTASADDGTAIRIDMETGEPLPTEPVAAGPEPGGIGVGDNAVWISSRRDNNVASIPQRP